MDLSARPVTFDQIASLRKPYRIEMDCQIIHDSIHTRPGWTVEYILHAGAAQAGYGSVAVAGPWQGKPTLYEFYVAPEFRPRMFDLFEVLLSVSGVTLIETQSNAPLLTVMLFTFSRSVVSESILFRDQLVTAHSPSGAAFRRATSRDLPQLSPDQLDAHGVVELDGTVAATGGILFHYNPPYGDIYMEVAEPFRRKGLGSYLVQELKRLCYQRGNIPSARCNPKNLASRKTLQKAGFVPCGHIIGGSVELSGDGQ